MSNADSCFQGLLASRPEPNVLCQTQPAVVAFANQYWPIRLRRLPAAVLRGFVPVGLHGQPDLDADDLPRRGVLQQSSGGRRLLMLFVVAVVRPGEKIAFPMARHRPIFNRRRMRRSIGGPNHRRMRRTL
jgi:hypothetical protein